MSGLERNARGYKFYEVAGWTQDGDSTSEKQPTVVLCEMGLDARHREAVTLFFPVT